MKKISICILALASAVWGDETLELLIAPEEISDKIKEVAGKIEETYQGEPVTLLMVMKGSICITSDLMRALRIPCTLDTIRASSYGQNGKNPGELYISGIEKLDLKGKNVLVVDDILDTGKTLEGIVRQLESLEPKSIKSLVLLLKDTKRPSGSYLPDFSLFQIENRFVVGYGLDYKELYRNLPGIYAFIGDQAPF